MSHDAVLGIDVAKDAFVAALLLGECKLSGDFPNSKEGYLRLGRWLGKHKAKTCHVCLEATGRYWEELALSLHEQGHKVSVVNPARIASYAKSQLARNKTDALDAELIARFCQREEPPAWTPPTPEMRELQAMARHRQALVANRTQEHNRLSSSPPSLPVRTLIEGHLQFLEAQITELERQIGQHIDNYSTLSRERELITSIPGYGDASAAKLIAENISAFKSARAVAAQSGLTPRLRQSGSSLHSKGSICRTGSDRLRSSLYFCALTAMRHNPLISRFAQRLRERGKPKMVVVVACMRKLLCLAWGVLKSGVPFDPNYAQHRQAASCT